MSGDMYVCTPMCVKTHHTLGVGAMEKHAHMPHHTFQAIGVSRKG